MTEIESKTNEHISSFARKYPDLINLLRLFSKNLWSFKYGSSPEIASVLSQVDFKSRIKTAESFKNKLVKKFTEDSSCIQKSLDEIVEDLVGFRLIFPSKKAIFEVLPQLLNNLSDFEAIKKEASTPLNENAKILENLGFEVRTRQTGYLGIHVIYKVKYFTGFYHKIELQVRTYFQDAWEVYDHEIYKQAQLTEDQVKMKQILAHQMENLADGFEYLRDKAVAIKTPESFFLTSSKMSEFYSGVRSNFHAELPTNFVGEFIKISSDPKIYLVTYNAQIRWIERAE